MEIIQFVFSSFWVWAGTLLLLSVVMACLSQCRLVEIRFSRDTNQNADECHAPQWGPRTEGEDG